MYAIYNPSNLEKLTKGMGEELAKLIAEGVSQKELDEARQGYLQKQQVMRTEDGNLAQVLEATLLTDRTMEFYAKQEQAISALTPEQVRYAFQKHVDAKKILTAVAGDWAAAEKKAAESTEKK